MGQLPGSTLSKNAATSNDPDASRKTASALLGAQCDPICRAQCVTKLYRVSHTSHFARPNSTLWYAAWLLHPV